LEVKKVPRTGLISMANLRFDYISIKAFMKEGIRYSSTNEKLRYWLPLYFGVQDNEERALKLGKNSISMIMTNSTRRFKESFILEVFSKIIVTTIFDIMD
jgi:hypothetical protein